MEIIMPVHQKLDSMNQNITNLKDRTDKALTKAANNTKAIEQLKTFESWSKSKIIPSDIKAHERIIKFRGISPNFVIDKDLTGSLNEWLQTFQPSISVSHSPFILRPSPATILSSAFNYWDPQLFAGTLHYVIQVYTTTPSLSPTH